LIKPSSPSEDSNTMASFRHRVGYLDAASCTFTGVLGTFATTCRVFSSCTPAGNCLGCSISVFFFSLHAPPFPHASLLRVVYVISFYFLLYPFSCFLFCFSFEMLYYGCFQKGVLVLSLSYLVMSLYAYVSIWRWVVWVDGYGVVGRYY